MKWVRFEWKWIFRRNSFSYEWFDSRLVLTQRQKTTRKCPVSMGRRCSTTKGRGGWVINIHTTSQDPDIHTSLYIYCGGLGKRTIQYIQLLKQKNPQERIKPYPKFFDSHHPLSYKIQSAARLIMFFEVGVGWGCYKARADLDVRVTWSCILSVYYPCVIRNGRRQWFKTISL